MTGFDQIPYTTTVCTRTRATDVAAINHPQCISANKSLYFSDWEKRSTIVGAATLAESAGSQAKHYVETMVSASGMTGKAYRKGSADEEKTGLERLGAS